MQHTDVKPGMAVAVNDLPSGRVYVVEALEGQEAILSFTTQAGKKLPAGKMSVGHLHLPTATQLANAKKG